MKCPIINNRDFSDEFIFKASRSSSVGGQNVNKVNTKVELRFSIHLSKLLTDDEKQTIISKLSSKLTTEGELIIVSQTERSQLKNKEKVIEKFYRLIEKALTPKKKRKPTKPSESSKEKRLEKKRKVSDKKTSRKKIIE